jgi:transposase-like protein
LIPFVHAAVEPGAQVVTDGWGGYNSLTEKGYRHVPVALSGNPDMADAYLPLVHLVFGNLKSWLRGCHHGVSPQHLQAYLNEYAFRFNRRFYPLNSFRSLLGIGGRPTYDGLYSGDWQRPSCSVQHHSSLTAL